MRKLFTLGLVLVSAVAFMGCTEEGSLEVYNDTDGWLDVWVDDDYTQLTGGGSVTYTWDFLPDEDKDVEVYAEGMFVLDYSSSVLIWGGEEDELEVWADAAALHIQNNLSRNLTEIYISPYNSDIWGDDLLSGTEVVLPGNYSEFTLEPYYYDVKVVDSSGEIYVKSWLDWYYLDAGTLYELTVDGKKGVLPGDSGFKKDGSFAVPLAEGEGRVVPR